MSATSENKKSSHLNHFGHLYDGERSLDGYGICSLCGCRENTDKAASDCLNDRPRWFVMKVNEHGKEIPVSNMIPADSADHACEIVRTRHCLGKNTQLKAGMH